MGCFGYCSRSEYSYSEKLEDYGPDSTVWAKGTRSPGGVLLKKLDWTTSWNVQWFVLPFSNNIVYQYRSLSTVCIPPMWQRMEGVYSVWTANTFSVIEA